MNLVKQALMRKIAEEQEKKPGMLSRAKDWVKKNPKKTAAGASVAAATTGVVAHRLLNKKPDPNSRLKDVLSKRLKGGI